MLHSVSKSKTLAWKVKTILSLHLSFSNVVKLHVYHAQEIHRKKYKMPER